MPTCCLVRQLTRLRNTAFTLNLCNSLLLTSIMSCSRGQLMYTQAHAFLNAQTLTEVNRRDASGWQSLEMMVMVIKYPLEAACTWSEPSIHFIFQAETRKIQNYFTVVCCNQTLANPCYQLNLVLELLGVKYTDWMRRKARRLEVSWHSRCSLVSLPHVGSAVWRTTLTLLRWVAEKKKSLRQIYLIHSTTSSVTTNLLPSLLLKNIKLFWILFAHLYLTLTSNYEDESACHDVCL